MTGRSGGGRGGNGGRNGGRTRKDSTGGQGGQGGGTSLRTQSTTRVSLNKELESNMFDLGEQSSKNMIWLQQENNLLKLQKRKVQLQAAIDVSTSDSDQEELKETMVNIDNKILKAKYGQSVEIKVPLNDEEKGEWETSKKAYGD
jgi:hypothetical protein